MKLLLDTHVFLWLNDNPERLSEPARAACENAGNRLYLSLASAWEIQIKLQLGKLLPDSPWQTLIKVQQEANGLALLPITLPHIETLSQLPAVHRDPFDRLLIAQALLDNMTIVTHDAAFSLYPAKFLN